MVSPKHSKMTFHFEDSSAEVLANANKQYILTKKIRSNSLIIVKLFYEKRRGEKGGR